MTEWYDQRVARDTPVGVIIWRQIPRYTRMLLGAKDPIYTATDTEESLKFSTTNHGGRKVVIRRNIYDLYDIEIGRVRGVEFRVGQVFNMVYADQLAEVLERAFGERS